MRKLVIWRAKRAATSNRTSAGRVAGAGGLRAGPVDQFFENGEALNQQMQQRFEAASEMGCVASRGAFRCQR